NIDKPKAVRSRIAPNNPTFQAQRKFTKTAAGRVYDNGLTLRRGTKVNAPWQKKYFPRGHFHFPFYRPAFVRGQCFVSPFGFYLGICAPYISASECHVFPPAVAFIDLPVYSGTLCNGFDDMGAENYLNDPNLDRDHPGLANALDALTETFQDGNIDGLVSLVDPNMSIAIYMRGRYRYSLSANDYLDLTRDAIQSTQTVEFSLTYLHQRAPDVFSLSGRHTYRDENGNVQTMWVSFVLQDIGGEWTLTQAGYAPARYQKLGG
ncbi:MAG TPA: hypothetical protein VMI31_10445, partial [Fimbriimonadaceae bacterium]|nr:hypothetical protein [Fimbriimonadaceae bacterium]